MAGPKLNARLGLDKREFDKGLKDAEKGVSSFGSKLKSFAAAAGLAVAAQQLIKYGAEAVKLAAKTEGIKNAFDNLNNPALLDNLRKATRNTVADVDLMAAAVKANNFHISLQALPRYFEFAQQRARATGESVDYLVESIVTGIGRKSPLILDNLGISLTDINEELKRTPDYAQAVGNIMEREMAKGGESVATTADSLEQLKAAMTNLKAEVGDMINDVLARPLAKSAESLTDVISGVRELREQLDLGGANKDLANQVRGNISMAGGTPAGYLFANLLGGRKVGKKELLIPSAAPITKTAPSTQGIDAVTEAINETDEAVKRTILDAQQLWNTLVMPAQSGQRLGGTWGALSGSFADPEVLAQAQGAAVSLNSTLTDQWAIVSSIQGTFTDLFSAGIRGWDEFGKAAVNALVQMLVQLAALGATYAALALIPGFAGFMEFIQGISSPMNIARSAASVNAGAASSVGSIGGDMTLRTEISGSNLAIVLGRGAGSNYNNT